MPLYTILIRTGPNDDAESHRFLAVILLLFAFGSACSLAIWSISPLVAGDLELLNTAMSIAMGIETLCFTAMAVELVRRTIRWQRLRFLAGLAMLTYPAANVWDYCTCYSIGFDFLGYPFESEQRPLAAFIPHMLSTTSWSQALPLLTILIASVRHRSLHWIRLATALCAGLVIEFCLTGGPKEFALPNGGLFDWLSYAVLITSVAATICLALHWGIRWGVLPVLIATFGFGIWCIVDAWISPNTHNSHLNELQLRWSEVLSMPSFVGPFFVTLWYAWRKPIIELPDDGSPWPRRYCGKCFYNLHGLDTDRCPECGAIFEATAVQV